MTIKNELTIAAQKMQKSGLKEPFLEAQWLLAAVLKKLPAFVLAHPEFSLKSNQIKIYSQLVSKRLQGWPFAYLVGRQEFYGLNFFVNKNVLIPRPETELMVEEIIKTARTTNGPKNIIDVGTGSGCILISLAENLPTAANYFFGLDISPAALKVARKNARAHKIKNCQFIQSNLLKTFLKKDGRHYQSRLKDRPLIIAANLPYLTPTQVKAEPSIKKEPRRALVAGTDGLKYYRRLFAQIKKLSAAYKKSDFSNASKPRPLLHQPLMIFCEIDPRQNAAFKNLVKTALPNFSCQIKSDLAGRDRLVIIKNK